MMKVRCEVVDFSHLAVDGVKWWNLVNMVMKLPVPLKAENFLIS